MIALSQIRETWSIILNYGRDNRLEVNQDNIVGRLIHDGDASGLTFDVPIPFPCDLTASIDKPGMRLLVIAVIFPSQLNSQQMIGPHPKIDLFDREVGREEQGKGLAFGRIDLLSSDGSILGTCTGFRISNRFWLTAGHCVLEDKDQPRPAAVDLVRIQPDDYAGKVETAAPFVAVPVATGQSGGKFDLSRNLTQQDLDYAVLEADKDPGGPFFSIDSAETSPSADLGLELFEHWTGSQPPEPGKARSADAECRLKPRVGNNDPNRSELCPNAYQHGCSSEPGASGGPLVTRSAGLQLVGLHYGQGAARRWNCGLPIITIKVHLCGNRPDVASRIMQCTR
jgi:hypothetical protein